VSRVNIKSDSYVSRSRCCACLLRYCGDDEVKTQKEGFVDYLDAGLRWVEPDAWQAKGACTIRVRNNFAIQLSR
jgi:hypothetical protein